MRRLVPTLAVIAVALTGNAARSQVVYPFEVDDGFTPLGPIDVSVMNLQRDKGVRPARLCSDEVFVRRVFLDVIGELPTADEARAFITDNRADKRAVLVDDLLQRDAFADYWALKWCDLLRVKSEFPINLWPNAVQAYHQWIRESIRANKPYDEFARELLTSSGSNFRVPEVNFYRAIQGRTPADIAAAVALTFMGVRIDNWSEERRASMAPFFCRVAYKKTKEWKEEIVYLDPAPSGAMDAIFPDNTPVHIQPGQDPRRVFADWLITPDNPWFAWNIVNRVWGWLMGRGIVHEPDDVRPDNPPSNPELLEYLADELVNANYDLEHVYRLILNSRTYQQSSIPRSEGPDAQAQFAYYPVRRLEAEVLSDALCWIGGEGESYSSAIPEPWTYTPDSARTVCLADGSITSSFLEMFGRPARDTGLESERNNQPTDAQLLYLLNSSDIQRKIERSPRLRNLVQLAGRDLPELGDLIYLTILSRFPAQDELVALDEYARAAGLGPKQVLDDIAWALINSKEFLYRH